MTAENNEVFEHIAEDLQKQIDNLGEVVVALDHTVRGNGQPGMRADLAVTKEQVGRIADGFDGLEDRVVQAIEKGLQVERERIQRSLKDTGEIKAITFPIIKQVITEEFEKRDKEAKENEAAPGTWRYFVDRFGTPIIMIIIGMLITRLPDILRVLLGVK